ncbi:MAG: hypothetical protein AB7N76_28920 [Planctomycetota bacterium]
MIHVLIGGAVGAIVAVGSTYLFLRLGGQGVSSSALVSAAVAGLVGGALASATLGAGGAAAAGLARNIAAPVVGGAGGGAAHKVVRNALDGRDPTEGAPEAAALGALSGAVGYGVSSAAGPALETAIRPLGGVASQAIQPGTSALARKLGEGVGQGVREGLRTAGRSYASGAAVGATRQAVQNAEEGRPLAEGVVEASAEGGKLGVLRAGVGSAANSVVAPLQGGGSAAATLARAEPAAHAPPASAGPLVAGAASALPSLVESPRGAPGPVPQGAPATPGLAGALRTSGE